MFSAKRAGGKVELMFSRFFFFFKTVREIADGLGALFLLRVERRRRRQVEFIRETLASCHDRARRRVIISLSTLPDRIAGIGPTLQCLLNQTRQPDEIVLSIPPFSLRRNKAYVIPPALAAISQLQIVCCDRDWGPATKFIPTIQRELAVIREPRPVAVVTGCGSYLIQPRFFDEALWDYSNAPAGAFFMDDIWISGCLDRRGVKKYVVPGSAMMRTAVRQIGTLTLHDVPGGRQPSNNETIRYFHESWNVFASR